MGVKGGRFAPAGLTWLLLAGLLAVFAGERIFSTAATAHWVLTFGGSLAVLAATLLRFLAWRRARGDGRALARLFLLLSAGCALAVLGFLAARPLGEALGGASEDQAGRVRTALVVLSAILLAVSLLGLLAAHWAAARTGEATAALDRLRVTRVAAAGATVGTAGAFLMLAGYVSYAWDLTLDLSYFKTASPGSAVTRIADTMGSPLRVLLFFPPASQVGDEVRGYFRALAARTDQVTVEEHDRLASPALAEEFGLEEDNTVVLSAGAGRTERITLPGTVAEARPRLRELDELVQRSLMRVARARRTVYLTVGHGELNDPRSADPLAQAPYGGIEALRSLFGLLNYEVSDLGVHNGLGQAIPPDAALVVVLGPSRPFLPAELQALDRYLAGGGAALLALEPNSGFQLGPLEQRLGVAFRDEPLADDQQHLQQRGNASDRQLIVTDRFSSHAALVTLGQAGVGAGIALLGAGHLSIDVPGSRAFVLVRSLPSTFPDRDRDFEPDAAEARDAYPLIVAVEGDTAATEGAAAAGASADTASAGPAAAPDPGTASADTAPAATAAEPRVMRAIVLSDADLFSDAVVSALGLNAALAADAFRWLGREEELSGETRSEEDVPITHTRSEDVGWFYATIFGMPALVLLAGLYGVRRRRRASAPGREP